MAAQRQCRDAESLHCAYRAAYSRICSVQGCKGNNGGMLPRGGREDRRVAAHGVHACPLEHFSRPRPGLVLNQPRQPSRPSACPTGRRHVQCAAAMLPRPCACRRHTAMALTAQGPQGSSFGIRKLWASIEGARHPSGAYMPCRPDRSCSSPGPRFFHCHISRLRIPPLAFSHFRRLRLGCPS